MDVKEVLRVDSILAGIMRKVRCLTTVVFMDSSDKNLDHP